MFKLFKKNDGKVITSVPRIKELVSKQEKEDSYILDDENAIIVTKNESNGYIMIHERLVDDKLVEVNRWLLERYYFGSDVNDLVIKNYNLFFVVGNLGYYDSIYNYKEDRFVVLPNIWNKIDPGFVNSVFNKYNGFLASFEISSDFRENDIFGYNSLVTGERITKTFSVNDGTYYALLNVDGTIRGNKLFKGGSLSRIIEIIDLDKYKSLNEFKVERKRISNEKKDKLRNDYYRLLETRGNGDISPYLDQEVVNILKLKK